MIFIDPRAGSAEFFNPVKRRVNGQAQLVTLDSADVAFEGNGPEGEVAIGIEVKEIADFLTSARSGRLRDQLGRMSDAYQFVYLLVYGTFRPSEEGIIETKLYNPKTKKGRWVPLAPISREQRARGRVRNVLYQYSEYDKFITSLDLKRNVMQRRSAGKLEVVWNIVNAYQWWQKPWDQHTSVEDIKSQTSGIYHKASLCQMVAAQLPGIGSGKAAKLARHFETAERLVNALPTELEQVEGVGRKLSVEIYGSLRRKE